MTKGRFDSSYNTRPPGFDTRPHWIKSKASDPEHIADHMLREACPFHDLRADGCFQPDHHGPGLGAHSIDPAGLVRRPDGNLMHTRKTDVGRGPTQGIDGELLPMDVEPTALHPTAVTARMVLPPNSSASRGSLPTPPISARPWNGTKTTDGYFQPIQYEPSPPSVTSPRLPMLEPRAFLAGGYASQWIGRQPHHLSSPYHDPPIRDPRTFHLRTGPAHTPVIPALMPLHPASNGGGSTASSKMNSLEKSPRSVYSPRKPLGGTFDAYPAHMPDPYVEPSLRLERQAIFTFHAQSKRSMPIAVPWSHGLHTAVPAYGPKVTAS